MRSSWAASIWLNGCFGASADAYRHLPGTETVRFPLSAFLFGNFLVLGDPSAALYGRPFEFSPYLRALDSEHFTGPLASMIGGSTFCSMLPTAALPCCAT
jgi:hypothetical protein